MIKPREICKIRPEPRARTIPWAKTCLLACLGVWFSCQTFSEASAEGHLTETQIDSLLTAAPAEAAFPGADAVILFEQVDFEVDDEGRMTRRVHRLQKLFTEWACRRLTDLRMDWDTLRQELKVHTCRTFMQDKQVLDTPANGFNEVTPDRVRRCADFLSVRQMVISHVGVERGCTIELDYEIIDVLPGPLPAGGLEFFQSAHPTLDKRVTITAPDKMELTQTSEPITEKDLQVPSETSHRRVLSFAAVNLPEASVTPQHTLTGDGRQTLSWHLKNLPGIPTEGNTSRRGDYLPYVVFGTASDWDNLAHQISEQTQQAMVLSPTMETWLKQTGMPPAQRDCSSRDTIERIAELVGTEVRTVQNPTGHWSREPRPANEVFNTACGTSWEKAILAMTLLHEIPGAPLTAGLVLAPSWHSSPHTASLESLEPARVLVRDPSRSLYLSLESNEIQTTPWELDGLLTLVLDYPSPAEQPGEEEPIAATHQWLKRPLNRGATSLSVNIYPQQGSGWQAEIDYSVQARLWHQARSSSPEAIAADLAKVVSAEAEVTSTRILELSDQALHLQVTASAEALGEEREGRIYLEVPRPPQGVLQGLPGAFQISSRDRQTPLFTGVCPGNQQGGQEGLFEGINLRLDLPEGFSLEYIPPDVQFEPSAEPHRFLGRYSQSCQQEEGALLVKRNLTIPGGIIKPADYPDFRRLVTTASRPADSWIILKKE
jgi:hypothetical protein